MFNSLIFRSRIVYRIPNLAVAQIAGFIYQNGSILPIFRYIVQYCYQNWKTKFENKILNYIVQYSFRYQELQYFVTVFSIAQC